MPVAEKTSLRCERCGEPMTSGSSQAGCLNCLLLDALERSADGEKAASTPAAPFLPAATGAHRYQHYEILTREDGNLWELGRGAMGVTYKALDVNLRVPVALKVINPRHAQSTEARQRFLREARGAARLRHPNVASVFHFGTITQAPGTVPGSEGGQEECFYAMEFVEGETLEERLRRAGPLDVRLTLEVALQSTRALMAAEKRGLVHRDLKPSNIMLVAEAETPPVDPAGNRSGHHGEAWVKVIDFGLAKATGAANADAMGESGFGAATRGAFVGTPQFASPEQFDGRPVDARSDLFSLGVVLWYGLTGELPFEGRSLAEIHDRQLHRALPLDQLTDAKVPAPLADLLGSLLAADPAARPASAAVLHGQLEGCREALQVLPVPEQAPPRRRWAWWTAGATLALCLLLAAGLFAGRKTSPTPPVAPATGAIDKSVAVLPFENLSADPNNAFFAEGVQDEVLTDLAKLADLRVISRTSVMQYKGGVQRNVREIGQALGVAYVVEGSVQRAGNQIRVTAQLIDVRADAHKWAEKYDRPLDNVFTIQSEIAQAIAGQLQVAISPQEHAAVAGAPTHDLVAYELYTRARSQWDSFVYSSVPTNADQIVGLLKEATRRDPQFVQAYTLEVLVLSTTDVNSETSPTKAPFRDVVATVERLAPGSADAYKVAAVYAHEVERDGRRTRQLLLQALPLAPNDPDIYRWLSIVELQIGFPEDSIAHNLKQQELKPADTNIPMARANYLIKLRRYPEAKTLLDQLAAAHPLDAAVLRDVQSYRGQLALAWKADPRAARAALADVPASYDTSGDVTLGRLYDDMLARDHAAAERDLAACPSPEIQGLPRQMWAGFNAWLRGDKAEAARLLQDVRPVAAARVTEAGNVSDAWTLINLATIDMCLGRQEESIAEARRALALYPRDQQAYQGTDLEFELVRMLGLCGQREEAISRLQALCADPLGPSYGVMRLDPLLDPLRGDPRFEALVAALKPKEAVQ